MTVFLSWLLIGALLLIALVSSGSKLQNIPYSPLRRAVTIAVTVICYPAFVLLAAADHFIQWVDFDGDYKGAKAHLKDLFDEITVGIYLDVKETW